MTTKRGRPRGIQKARGEVGGSTCGRRFGQATKQSLIEAQLRGEDVRAGEGYIPKGRKQK